MISFILKIAPNTLYATGLGLVAWGGFSVYVSIGNWPLAIPLIVAGGATMIGGALMVDESELNAKEAQMTKKRSWRKER